jgi:hypothetical protein
MAKVNEDSHLFFPVLGPDGKNEKELSHEVLHLGSIILAGHTAIGGSGKRRD